MGILEVLSWIAIACMVAIVVVAKILEWFFDE